MGYRIYCGPTPDTIDWPTPVGSVVAGVATIDVDISDLPDGVDRYFAVRAVSDEGVEEPGVAATCRVRIEDGLLIGPPPNPLAWAKARATADGHVEVSFEYITAGELAAVAAVEIVRLVAGKADWGDAESVAISTTAVRAVELAATFATGEQVRLAARAVTALGSPGPVLTLTGVVADATSPASAVYASAAQEGS